MRGLAHFVVIAFAPASAGARPRDCAIAGGGGFADGQPPAA